MYLWWNWSVYIKQNHINHIKRDVKRRIERNDDEFNWKCVYIISSQSIYQRAI